MSEQEKNTERNVRLAPEQIKIPAPSMLEKAVSGFFRKRAEKKIKQSIREYAMTPEGGLDNDLADILRDRLTLRSEMSLHRDVLEPMGWAAISGAAVGVGALAISKEVEGKALTRGSVFAAVASTALGAALDVYRVKRRFDSGMEGALSGALRAVREERNPRWNKTGQAETVAAPQDFSEHADDNKPQTEAKWAQREAERREKSEYATEGHDR